VVTLPMGQLGTEGGHLVMVVTLVVYTVLVVSLAVVVGLGPSVSVTGQTVVYQGMVSVVT
jgi:hypothetical protein